MWQDKVRERYWWAGIQNQIDELMYELSKAEEEEAAVLYLLGLYVDNAADLKFFDEKKREKIKGCLSVLMNHSARHRELLNQAAERLAEKKRGHAQPAV